LDYPLRVSRQIRTARTATAAASYGEPWDSITAHPAEVEFQTQKARILGG